jgi:hypothetical protein
MKKKIYLIQPTYRLMDGTLVKEFPLFNYSYNLPILSASIPPEWEKCFCLEYSDEVDFHTDASVIVIMSPGYDIDHAVDIALEFKRQKKIVVFGAHMDDLSDRLMKDVCHSVFYGYPTRLMMEKILSDIESGGIKPEYQCGMNIDFPFDYSVLRDKNMWFLPVLASLGCRHTCSYCCYTPIYGGKYRLRHIDNVITDLRSASSLRRPLAFLDANLYNNRQYLIRLCQRIIVEGLRIRWGGQCTINIGDDPEVLKLMREAGCHMLFFGLETLDQRNMVQLNKPFDTGMYARQVAQIRKSGIHVAAFFMLGLDEDTEETFERVYEFFRQTRITVPYIHLLFPVPGTPLEQSLKAQHRLPAGLFDQYLDDKPEYSVPCSFAYFTPAKLSPGELESRYLHLFRRLTSIPQILRRCVVSNPFDAGIILMMNLEARRKCRAMIRAHETRKE